LTFVVNAMIMAKINF